MRNRIVITFLTLFALLFVACSTDAAPLPAASSPSSSTQLSGTIEIDGSSTVFPVSEAVAEEFGKVQPKVRVNVGVSGTGGGFKRFAVGETDISDASRQISDKEKEIAVENGITYHEILVGTDGLSVVVSNKNDFVNCLTVPELKSIWEPGSTIQKWNEVRSTFPAEAIKLYGPDTDSGTFDYFTEEIIGEVQSSRADYQASADDNTLVRGVSGTKYALGYFGYSYYIANKDKLKVVAIDNGDGCVVPSAKTIEDGTYKPLSRPLFIYVSKKSLERPEVKMFVNFYLEMGRKLVAEVDYIPLPAEQYAKSMQLIQ